MHYAIIILVKKKEEFNNMKKKLILLPIFALLLAGCGNKSSEDTSAPPSSSEGGIELPSSEEPLSDPSSEKESIPDTDYVTIEEARIAAKEADTNVTIKGTITEIYGMASNKFGVIVQEGNYALTLAFVEDVTDLAIGDYVSATGKTQIFNGLYQLSDSTITKLEGDAPVITPMEITEWSNEDLEGKDGAQVVVDGLKYVSGKITVGTNSPIDVKLGEKQFQIYMSRYIDTEIQEALKAKFDSVTINDTIKFTGAVGMYNNYQLNPLRAETIEITKGEAVTLSALGFNPAAKEITVEDEYDAAATLVVTPNGAPIEGLVYASSDPEVATVDAAGKVTAVAPGSATITAKVGEIVGELALTVKAAPQFVYNADFSAKEYFLESDQTGSSYGYATECNIKVGNAEGSSLEWKMRGVNPNDWAKPGIRFGGKNTNATIDTVITEGLPFDAELAAKVQAEYAITKEPVVGSVSKITVGVIDVWSSGVNFHGVYIQASADAEFTNPINLGHQDTAIADLVFELETPLVDHYYRVIFANEHTTNKNTAIIVSGIMFQ